MTAEQPTSTVIVERRQRFVFPAGWRAWKQDETTFYRKRFQSLPSNPESVDIVAIDPDGCCWLIEIKDYRVGTLDLPQISDWCKMLSGKVCGTLACLITAACRPEKTEIDIQNAQAAIAASRFRIVLQVELPRPNGRGRKRAHEFALRKHSEDISRRLKALCGPAEVRSSSLPSSSPIRWQVEDV